MKNIFLQNKKQLKNNQNLEEEKSNLVMQGSFNFKDYISPSYIDFTNPKYIEIDNMFFSSLLAVNYSRIQNDLILKQLIDSNINMNISIFYEKQDSYKAIRELTYHIGNTGVDVKYTKNRQDIDLVAFTHDDAIYIRKEMQVNKEDLYYLFIYLNLFSSDLKELKYSLSKIEGLCQTIGIQTRRAFFRQEQAYFSCLPIAHNHLDIKNICKRNILTTGLLATYPFISSSIFDENGIFVGINIYNNSLVFVDKFNLEKYKNSNMCVFGTSGAGKSFYIKLMILRYRLFDVEQYIVDPEREYIKICKSLSGAILKIGPRSKTYINIMDIREESLEEGESGYLAIKIEKLIGFLNLIFGNLNEEEKAILEEKIIECYYKKNIIFEDESLFNKTEKRYIF